MLRATLCDGLLFLYLYPCFLVVGNIKCLWFRNCCLTSGDGQLRTEILLLRTLCTLSNLDFSQRTQPKADTPYSFKSICQKFSPMIPPLISTGLHLTLSNVLDKLNHTHRYKRHITKPTTKAKNPTKTLQNISVQTSEQRTFQKPQNTSH